MLSGVIILNDLGGRPAISATLVAVLPPFLMVYFEERTPKPCDACWKKLGRELSLFLSAKTSVHLAITITILPRSKNLKTLTFMPFVAVLLKVQILRRHEGQLFPSDSKSDFAFVPLNGFHSLPFQISPLSKKLRGQASRTARRLPTAAIEPPPNWKCF